jgi:hypothetical protein
MIRVLLFLLALVGPAMAETARVLSGEHAEFTRLVVELPEPGDWRVGRNPMGYAFAVAGEDQPAYDLSQVWQRIPRTRLQALRVDPDSGALTLTLACPCHVQPFEYRPGTIVLDIRNGPAPIASAFEAPFVAAVPPVSGTPPLAEAPVLYDWRSGLPNAAVAEDRPPPVDGGIALAPLRDALLTQISRGAVEGLVDMQLPDPIQLPEDDLPDLPSGIRLGLGPLPGIALDLGEPNAEPVPTCLPDRDLALSDWAGDRPATEILVEARSGLYGEFDALDPEAVLRAVRLHLALGFGAEARQYARLLPEGPQPEALATLLSIARLMDGDADPATPFAAMLGCDGAAALWAALAHTSLPTAAEVDVDAIVRSFTALPPHLRRHLGPRLADLLLPKDAAAARQVRDTMARTPDIGPGLVALADARAELQAGRPEAALGHAQQALDEGSANALALAALVEAHAEALKPLPIKEAEAILALQQDAGTGAVADSLARAALLALALSGQADRAFAEIEAGDPSLADLWRVTVALAEDSVFLVQALAAETDAPALEDGLALQIAARLLQLGFPDAALVWLGPVDSTRPVAWRLLAAEAELRQGDPRQALTLVTGLEDAAALDLRLQAETGLGALEAAQRSAEAAGLEEEASRLAALRADWSGLAATAASPWAELATYAGPSDVFAEGPLARGAALLETSADARAAVEALLSAVDQANP